MTRLARILLLACALMLALPACAELASLLGVAAPVAAQAAGSALAAAVASFCEHMDAVAPGWREGR